MIKRNEQKFGFKTNIRFKIYLVWIRLCDRKILQIAIVLYPNGTLDEATCKNMESADSQAKNSPQKS